MSDHGGVLDVTGSPRLVTLRLESPCAGSPVSHWDPACIRPTKSLRSRAHACPTGPGPHHSALSRYYTRQSEVYASHHGSTGLPPGTAGEPNRHAEEVQGERLTECVDGMSKLSKISRNKWNASATTPGGLWWTGVTRAGTPIECVYGQRKARNAGTRGQ
jgi:hypothetical protein